MSLGVGVASIRGTLLGDGYRLLGALNLTNSTHNACVVVDHDRFRLPLILWKFLQLENRHGANVHTDSVSVALFMIHLYLNQPLTTSKRTFR